LARRATLAGCECESSWGSRGFLPVGEPGALRPSTARSPGTPRSEEGGREARRESRGPEKATRRREGRTGTDRRKDVEVDGFDTRDRRRRIDLERLHVGDAFPLPNQEPWTEEGGQSVRKGRARGGREERTVEQGRTEKEAKEGRRDRHEKLSPLPIPAAAAIVHRCVSLGFEDGGLRELRRSMADRPPAGAVV
jgi:hypothetical protein